MKLNINNSSRKGQIGKKKTYFLVVWKFKRKMEKKWRKIISLKLINYFYSFFIYIQKKEKEYKNK